MLGVDIIERPLVGGAIGSASEDGVLPLECAISVPPSPRKRAAWRVVEPASPHVGRPRSLLNTI
eukprot:10968260-Prorocentrum_lima.AAC.1